MKQITAGLGLVTGFLVLIAHMGSAAAQSPAMMTVQMPQSPEPVPVTLNPKTTALLVLDITDVTCKPQANCVNEMVPHIRTLLAEARKQGMLVAYSRPGSNATILPDVAPEPADVVLSPLAQDKFYGSDLDAKLKARGVTHIILTGWRINGAVSYTSVGATLRGYTVVVPIDTSYGPKDWDVAIGRYQILTQLSGNPTNTPLKPNASTLSRSDLISLK